MKLDRNINPSGKGKYALNKMRKISGDPRTAQELAAAILANPECVEFGMVGTEGEFWVTKLKDRHAQPSLLAYAGSALTEDAEYAREVAAMAARSGVSNPFCKSPD